jgi:O-antigen ligase
MGLFEAIVGFVQYFVFHQRARGTFFNPDFFGEYLAIIFCIALGLILEDGRKRSVIASETKQTLSFPQREIASPLARNDIGGELPRPLWALAMTNRLVGILSLLLLATGIFLSQSRGSALAWFAGISVVLWKRFRFRIVYAWLTFFLLFLIIPNPLQHRFLHDYREDPYSLSRFDMWKEAIHIIRDRPMGIGLEMFPLISPQYAFPINSRLQHYSKVAESPHNEYLRLFSELGIIGGFFFLGAIVFFYLKWIDKKDQSFTYFGIVGGVVIFFVHAMVDSNFHEPALVTTVIILSTFLVDRNLFQFTDFRKLRGIKKIIFYPVCIAVFIVLGVMVVKPAMGLYFYSKGYVQIKNHREDTAQTNHKRAIFWERQNARYHNALANVYYNFFQKTNYYGWIFKALEELNVAIKLNSMDGNYYKLKGAIYKTLAVRESQLEHIEELYGKAFTNYKEALKLLPYDVSIYVELGEIHEHYQRINDAGNVYNRAVILEPNYLLAREKKVELLLKTGKQEEALKDYQELVSVYNQIKSRAVTDSDKAFIYFNQEKLEKLLKGFNLRHS